MAGDVDAMMNLPTGYQLHAFDSLESTSTTAKDMAAKGCPHGTIVWAKEQTKGRGRHGNSWTSLDGNLFCSFVFYPDIPKSQWGQMSFVTAVALAEVIESYGIECQVKWPNDVMIDGKKTAGILLEAEDNRVIVGVGVNLVAMPDGFARVGQAATPEDVLQKLSWRLAHWLDVWQSQGFESVRAAWLKRAFAHHQPIKARLATETLDGIFEDLDETGALVLRLEDNTIKNITSGEVYTT